MEIYTKVLIIKISLASTNVLSRHYLTEAHANVLIINTNTKVLLCHSI